MFVTRLFDSAYQIYLNDYFLYKKEKQEGKKIFSIYFEETNFSDSHCIRLTRLRAKKPLARRNFLIVPSIFNSPEILYISGKASFVNLLARHGDVYLINWQHTETITSINDYVLEVIKLLKGLNSRTGKIELVGHCFGGNIALGVSCLANELICSLTLLTTPWDYSHLSGAGILYKLLNFEAILGNAKTVPRFYWQIMFFLLFPLQFNKKISQYENLKQEEQKLLYMRVESWLQSGSDIPSLVYKELIDKLINQNIFLNKGWSIEGELIDPGNITLPVCIISAMKDQIAPPASIIALHEGLKKPTLIKVKGGHISYLLNSNKDFVNSYNVWLSEVYKDYNNINFVN